MANPEHVKVVRQGAAAIAEWRRQNRQTHLELSGADLRGANLSRANLRGADLSGADLTGGDLSLANLMHADVKGAVLVEAELTLADLLSTDFSGADLTGAELAAATLHQTNLSMANLAEASLIGANLFDVKLANANLAEAAVGLTSLAKCDLSPAKGLSSVVHLDPSSIGVDTLIRSFRGAGNKLTPDLETFFLGAGVPKELLTALPRIIAEVKYYSCFISYGQADVDFAKRLREELAAKGVSCWLYDLDATPGERTWKEIGEARRQAEKMVVVCSVKALLRDGVLKEIEEQIDEDPDKMVPISRDDIWTDPGFRVVRAGRDLTPFLRDRNYAAFSDESRYGESLQRLLKALRRKAE